MFNYGNKSAKAPLYKFWTYDYCQNFELKQEFIDAYKQKGKFFEDALYFFDYMSTSPHPMFKQEKESIEPYFINFTNIKIDINTLKILFTLLPNSKIITLKCSSNSFEFSNFEYLINQILNKPTNIYNLILEWNDEVLFEGKSHKMIDYLNKSNTINLKNNLDNNTNFDDNDNILDKNNTSNNLITENNNINIDILEKQKSLFAKLTLHTRLDSLCLRGNLICDNAGIVLFENLKQNSVLRVLNLYRNNLSSAIINSVVSMIEVNRKLEELNLGNNRFKDEDFRLISKELGKYKISEEENEELMKKIKEKNEIIEKNKKLKASKKPELPLPVVPDIETIGEINFMIKNNKLKNLNFMQNEFTKEVYNDIMKVVECTEEMLLVFDIKLFDKYEKEKLNDQRNKYSSKVYLVK